MKKLFISPHPDDVEIGCGGSIARFVAGGHVCDIAVAVGDGDLKMRHSGEVVPFQKRIDEQLAAAGVLGVSTVHWLNIAKAAHLDTVSLAVGTTVLDKLLAEEKYSEVYIPLPSYNQDHQYVCDMCMAATRPPGRYTLFMYEQPTQFHGVQSIATFASRFYVTFSPAEQEKKEKALSCHVSQVKGRQESITGLRGLRLLAELRGAEVGRMYAEMFHLLRQVI
jgi:LmbE family N-acetylglucosaminyl deacetylase